MQENGVPAAMSFFLDPLAKTLLRQDASRQGHLEIQHAACDPVEVVTEIVDEQGQARPGLLEGRLARGCFWRA